MEQVNKSESIQILGKAIPASVYDFFRTAGIALVICIFVYLFIASPNQIEGSSMLPTLFNKELIITDKIDRLLQNEYSRGDIIVFQKPGHKDFVKRIIGLPGEKVGVHNGHVFINNNELKEIYLGDVYTIGGDFISDDGQDLLIPQNRYFVLGDNRADSLDSRYSDIGLINKDWIKGKVIVRYWPITRFSLFNKPNYNI